MCDKDKVATYKHHLLGRKGERSNSWKGGKPKCKICGKQLKCYTAKYCMNHKNINVVFTEERRKRVGEQMKGNKHNLGKKLSDERKEKIRAGVIRSADIRGRTRNNPYGRDWGNILKNKIRERDDNKCRVCYLKSKKRALDVHHIDYNKKNCEETNLISLCASCHSTTSGNRKYWEQYFKERIKCQGTIVVQSLSQN